MATIETPRLLLRRWESRDLDPFIALNGDPRVMRFFPKILSPAESEDFCRRIEEEFDRYGYGLFAAETKDDGRFAGFIGFHRATFDAYFTPCIEIGWRLRYDLWNRGLCSEGARACLGYGSGELGLKEIYSFTAVANLPSQRVMQKIGMHFAGHFNHPALPAGHPLSEHVLYKYTIDKEHKN